MDVTSDIGHTHTMPFTIEPLAFPVGADDLDALDALLVACVRGGASIGFLEGITPDEARGYWAKTLPEAEAGRRLILVAREGPGSPLLGCVQLAPATFPNGRHRAEVMKLLVFPEHRRRGIATALMAETERQALAWGLTLLFLDTSEGPSGARALYDTLGFHYAGGIPGYAVDPDGTPSKNAIYFKFLA